MLLRPRRYSRRVRGFGGLFLFVGLACLLVAGVSLLLPQIRDTSEQAAKKIERRAEDGKPPKVEVGGGDPSTVPWTLLVCGTGLVVAGLRMRRLPPR